MPNRAEVMVIAPASPDMDRSWWWRHAGAIHWIETEPAEWTPLADLLGEATHVQLRATLRRMYHPSWRIILQFYVDDRLGLGQEYGRPVIPVGYVMPGWIVGQKLEMSPL